MSPLPAPAYTADNSPPSYDEVAGKLERLVGSNPTVEKALEAANSLSEEEIFVLANGYEDHKPLQTDQQKADFTVGAGQHLSSEEGQNGMALSGSAASQASVNIDSRLIDIQQKLAVIDQKYNEGFADTVAGIRQDYNQVLQNSRNLAADISQKGKSFDKVIVKYCADSTISLEDRKAKAKAFVSDINKLGATAEDIQEQFSAVKNNFSSFVDTYSTWAEGKEGELTQQIADLEQEIRSLTQELNSLETAEKAMVALAGAALPIAGALGEIFQPVKPLILIGGLIFAGVSLAAALGLYIAAGVVKNKINQKTYEKQDLEKLLETIRSAHQDLQGMQQSGLLSFQACLDVLPQYWSSTVQNAQSIYDWLEKGGETARPVYMNLNVEKGVESYNATAAYLDTYARGL
ncbi:uncharacterized protein BO88DRAFT_451997 [Aspergillus vadensis CBS 113365]|uniref:Uncharacterized protein n=1 Tax=Aspergillus vadensis (strain CBS 113365 / IMI 142717 / IBT 24658) TaxID=1448311 RepID=A0A319BF04_ASPVC|nr:hypothetical protein BO88DRAFT_451997 [Aspergillus vadensis CBS 113365]PYH71325.1 hypothetical protein BO88DRAFT_451997 [Aspergillus vadensis CBS 113365]